MKYLFCLLSAYSLSLFLSFFPGHIMAEGTKELNSNNVQSTKLYLCNDFTNHCNTSNGVRSQFAVYDETQSSVDVDRLYFVTLNSSEVVYLGFQGGGLSNPVNPARHIVYRIKNLAGTIVQAEQVLPTSGTGYISTFTQAVNGPNQLGITTGYTAVVFTPPAAGTYFIEFSCRRDDNNNFYIGNFQMLLIDITVAGTSPAVAKPGRVYSKAWEFVEDQNFYGTNYIISDDSIITSAQFTGMQGGTWVTYCNQTGCGNSSANWITNRKSLYHQQALYPQYKIFLNNPDPALFPAATTLGQLVAPMPYGVQNCTTGHIIFHVNVNKPGNVEVTLTFPSPYVQVVLNQAVVVGENLFDWDGLDGTTPVGVQVPNNTNISFTVKYINGLTNLPLYDVEGNVNGFTIALVNPAGSTPAVFWDDTNIPGGINNSSLPGCTTPPCHSWAATGGGWGNLNTVNTWWYNVSTTTSPVSIAEWRGPDTLVINQSPPQAFCAGTGGHVFSVTPDPNTEVYHWSYTPSTGVTITSNGNPSVTVSFGAGASSGTLSVYGTNTNCTTYTGPTSSIPVTINPTPVPTLTGLISVCQGQTNVTYTTESGKTNYMWTVSSGGMITSGGSSTSNTVTVTWNSSGSQSVSVSYQSGTPPCQAAAPTVLPVTVNPRPVPGLSGPQLICVGSSGIVYSTESGKLNYTWSVSSGGIITGGGNSTSNTVTVTWSVIGAQYVTVSYTDPVTQCTAASPTQYNVTVNSLPVPTFTAGPTSACLGLAGNFYATQAGMTNYIWNVTGGIITAGGSSSSNTAAVTWNTLGNQSISVNYTLPFSSCTALTPTVMQVTVNPLPVPQITGNNSVCVGIPGNTYTTQSGKSNYIWNVTGGIITSGGGTWEDFVTVTWTNTGNQTVTVNYTEPLTYCTASQPSVYHVTVKPLPVPSIVSGSNSVCLNSPGNVYTTQGGMNNYQWNITGGTVTAGGTLSDSTVTITWITTGDQTISLNYTDPVTGCTAAQPITFWVNIKPLPVPSFVSGPVSACQLSQNNIYVTQPGMVDYSWQVTGGTIVSGGTSADASANITWNIVGNQTVTVLYTDAATQCRAAAPAVMDVEVKVLPIPEILGPVSACVNSAGPQYITESGMSDYTWSITGGTITGNPSPETSNVTWTTIGNQNISVSYTALNGCRPAQPSVKTVVVNTLPVPQITGSLTVCSEVPYTYQTESGMSNYTWNVTGGATIVSGGTASDESMTVIWPNAGSFKISVNYALGTGCTAAAPSEITILVNPTPHPSIAENPPGRNCITFTNAYSTETGMSAYNWSVSGGGNLMTSANGQQITVLWNNTGSQWVNVRYTNTFGCPALVPVVFPVIVNPLPQTTITPASGPDCETLAHNYQANPDPPVDFQWSVNPVSRGLISTGQGTNLVSVLWQTNGSATISVTGTNTITGCFASSSLNTTVYPKPQPSFTPCFDVVTTSSAQKIILRGASPYLIGQGVFSGNRVSLNNMTGLYEFDPQGASAGWYPVTYTFTNNYGCPGSASPVNIQVQNSNFSCGGTLTDPRDGNSYPTTLIGGKCWMTKNLVHGTELGWMQPATDNCIDERSCQPADQGCTLYGGFYQWNEMMRYGYTYNNQGICPPAWHIPSEQEWNAMLYAMNTGVNPPEGVVGSFLKDPWLTGGIHALSGGLFYLDNHWAFTSGTFTGTMFWTSTPFNPDKAVARGVNSTNPSNSRYPGNKENSFSVRCVKDQ